MQGRKHLNKLLVASIFCHFLTLTICWAQSPLDLEISGTYKAGSAASILIAIESDYPVRFYYQAEELAFPVSELVLEKTPLVRVLNQLFESTSLGFSAYRDYAIVIAPKLVIEENFTASYYQALEKSLNEPEPEAKASGPIVIGQIEKLGPNGKATITATVLDAENGEPIIGATVLWEKPNGGTTTDENGVFSSTLPSGAHQLTIQYIGYADLKVGIQLNSDGAINLTMSSAAVDLAQITVASKAIDANVQDAQVGITRLDIKSLKKLPSFLGETDIINTLLLQPGVNRAGEGASGFYVRGGEADQNLLLQDEGFIFNASHALGFFSTFNTDLANSVTLYKGNLPAQYGGRLASALDVELRDGDFQRLKTKGGIGLVSSRISLEGPIAKDKTSFLAGFRSSYSDYVLDLIQIPEVRNSSAFFYDANLRLTHRFNDKNSLIFSGYATKDDFSYNEEFGFGYSTYMGQLIYKKIYSDRLFSRFSITGHQYNSNLSDLDGSDASDFENNIGYYQFKGNITHIPNANIRTDIGIASIYYHSAPGKIEPADALSTVRAETLEKEQGLESSAYFNAEWTVSPQLLITGGLRISYYQFLGPKSIYLYTNPAQPNINDATGLKNFGSGKVIADYLNLEPRLSFRYRLGPENSFKGGYGRTVQYVNQITNTNTAAPSSLWQISTDYILPQKAHNFSFGYFHNFKNNKWETSAEVYYRIIDQLFDYKDFADLTVNEHLETELLNGNGRAYGLELSIKKNTGYINGFLSYTLARAERTIEGINNGSWYPSNNNRPHDLSLVLNFQPNMRHTLTLNFNYASGRPLTVPLALYQESQRVAVPIYSLRNAYNIPDYHRLDFAYTIGQGYRKDRKLKTSWTISLYNLYSRRNAFSVFFTRPPFGDSKASRLSILGNVFPALTINFETL